MTRVRIKLTKVEDFKITFDENASELILESKTDKFPEMKSLIVPAGTSIGGLRTAARFLANVANFVILQVQLHM
jgi:hypothetical protein